MNQRTQSDPRLARLAGLMASRYAFLSQLGAGGSGTVYEVRNLSLDRREALANAPHHDGECYLVPAVLGVV